MTQQHNWRPASLTEMLKSRKDDPIKLVRPGLICVGTIDSIVLSYRQELSVRELEEGKLKEHITLSADFAPPYLPEHVMVHMEPRKNGLLLADTNRYIVTDMLIRVRTEDGLLTPFSGNTGWYVPEKKEASYYTRLIKKIHALCFNKKKRYLIGFTKIIMQWVHRE